jgi:hypothetical protein
MDENPVHSLEESILLKTRESENSAHGTLTGRLTTLFALVRELKKETRDAN